MGNLPRISIPVHLSAINAIPRDFTLSFNQQNVSTSPVTVFMQNYGAYGLDWTVMNSDSTATNYLNVDVDGVVYYIAGGGLIESHNDEPYNSLKVTGLSTLAQIRVAGKKFG